MESVSPSDSVCPICGGRFQPLYTIDRFTPPFSVLECCSCGLQRQANLPPPHDLALLYDRGYYEGTAAFSYEDERKSEAAHDHVWQARLRTIARHVPPPADFLDVGCSFGGFVDAARRAGYRSSGLDISQFAVSEGVRMGRNLHHATLDQAPFPDASFDVITLIEVLEHLADPRSTMQQLARLLRPGGLLVVQTANFLGWQARSAAASYHYYLPGHLFYYSTRNLELLLQQNGFGTIRFYRGVDFGLLPKLRKMRSGFGRQGNRDANGMGKGTKLSEYRRIWGASLYHLKSKVAFGHFALTSSMVCYARKGGKA